MYRTWGPRAKAHSLRWMSHRIVAMLVALCTGVNNGFTGASAASQEGMIVDNTSAKCRAGQFETRSEPTVQRACP